MRKQRPVWLDVVFLISDITMCCQPRSLKLEVVGDLGEREREKKRTQHNTAHFSNVKLHLQIKKKENLFEHRIALQNKENSKNKSTTD